MPPASASAPSDRPRRPAPSDLLGGYQAALAARGAGNKSFDCAARAFLARWPDPQGWAAEPLAVRLSASPSARPFLNYLMLSGQLHPGYDYLLERKLPAVLREAAAGPLGAERARFVAAADELGYLPQVTAGMCSQITMRLLIQTGRPVTALSDADIAAFGEAITARERASGRRLKHYRDALHATWGVAYHMGAALTPPPGGVNRAHLRCRGPGTSPGPRPGSAARWRPTWNAPRPPGPAPPCSASPPVSATSPGSWPGTTPRWPRWPAWTGSVTSSPTWPRWPRPATRAPGRSCPPRSGAAGS